MRERTAQTRRNSHCRNSRNAAYIFSVKGRMVKSPLGKVSVKDGRAEPKKARNVIKNATVTKKQRTFLQIPALFVLSRIDKRKEERKMKKILSLTLALLMLLSICLFAVSCKDGDKEEMLYTEDTTLGTGSKTIILTVEHFDGQKVTFTVKTDKTILADALLEHNLIEGETDIYGLYVKKVNGITRDYNKDRTYWALYVNGEYSMEGVSSVEVTEGATYTYKAETY